MATHKWFIELLESQRATFDDEAYPLPKYQSDAFQSCYELMREHPFSKRSKQRRSTMMQTHTLLTDVFLSVGPEVFLLCTLSTSISKLATITLKGLVPELRRWWKTVSHPQGLSKTANELCQANSVDTLVNSARKRKHSEVYSDITENKPVDSSESVSLGCAQPHQNRTSGSDIRNAQPLHNVVTDRSLAEQELSKEEHATIPNRPTHQPDESILDLKLTDLLSFLQQYQTSCPSLQITCPWAGVPLPSVVMNLDSSLGLNAKLELSAPLTAELMKYIGASKIAATEVSHGRVSKKHARPTSPDNNHNKSSPLARTRHYVPGRNATDSPRTTVFPDEYGAD
ncbi:MAG: hypothetical protein M1816_002682 [Peltula sp. TS41687]|nr:MAG: hypothetical protein M1816_002682 [Peltula sp. TS41687]